MKSLMEEITEINVETQEPTKVNPITQVLHTHSAHVRVRTHRLFK